MVACRPGGLGLRFFARLIDGILVNIVVFLLSIFLFDRDYWFLVTGLFSGVLMFGYFVLFEISRGASPGKSLLGLAVHRPGRGAEAGCETVRHPQLVHLARVVPYLGGLLAFIAYIVIAVTISAAPQRQARRARGQYPGGQDLTETRSPATPLVQIRQESLDDAVDAQPDVKSDAMLVGRQRFQRVEL